MTNNKFTIISAYTKNTSYEKEVINLKDSLLKCDVNNYEIIAFDSFGSWSRNCQYKAVLIKESLKKYDHPIVWLDADAVLCKYPSLFHDIDKDIAYCKLYGQVASGTLFFKPTELVFKIMDDWIKLNNINHNRFDQSCLFEVINKNNYKRMCYFLPIEYCKIFDLGPKCEDPTIIHNQASRRFKKEINTKTS